MTGRVDHEAASGGSARPLVSVLMPAHNAAETISAAVQSALMQEMPSLEVIVSDDGSDVLVSSLLAGLEDDRLRVVRSDRRCGVSAARNLALAYARAPIVAQLDADDTWAPFHLTELVRRFDDARTGLVYANARVSGHPAGLTLWISREGRAERSSAAVVTGRLHPVTSARELYVGNPIPALTVAMRTEAVRAVGGYPEWLSVGEEYLLYMRLFEAGWKFSFVDQVSAEYRWPTPGRGVTFNRRHSAREHAKLFLVLSLRHPGVPEVRRRLGKELVHLITTHVPGTLFAGRHGRRLWSRIRSGFVPSRSG